MPASAEKAEFFRKNPGSAFGGAGVRLSAPGLSMGENCDIIWGKPAGKFFARPKSGETEEVPMKRCFIFAAGSFYGLRERPAPGDLVIAADAGYLLCQKLAITPDLVLGDFDSMAEPSGVAVHRSPVEKDDTDAMLALKTGLEKGCDAFYLYGFTGGKRLDHTLANLQSLLFLRRRGTRGWLYGDDFLWTAIENESLTVQKEVEWGLFSAFCLGDRAEGVDETGLQYPLCNAVLTPEFPLGVSNHFLEQEAVISVRRGALLVGWELAYHNP